jgi:hypothetical protein
VGDDAWQRHLETTMAIEIAPADGSFSTELFTGGSSEPSHRSAGFSPWLRSVRAFGADMELGLFAELAAILVIGTAGWVLAGIMSPMADLHRNSAPRNVTAAHPSVPRARAAFGFPVSFVPDRAAP